MTKLLLVFLLLPLSLFAQNPVGMNSWFCCEPPCNPCVHFTSEADLKDHNCKVHGIGCPVGEATNNGGGKMMGSPIQWGIGGGLICGLVGSLMTDPQGDNQALTGGAIGYGVFSGLSLLTSKKERTVGGNIINGILTGGSLGYGAAKVEKSYGSDPKKDNTALYSTIGAVTVAAGNVAFHKKTKGGYDMVRRRNKVFLNTAMNFSGNRLGIVVRL
ncbi:MAG: hypothetical protein IPQ08_00530 [Chitinophagaceae bacterium]|nr:hypothetical protein [Chitinophagaceae bacterium]